MTTASTTKERPAPDTAAPMGMAFFLASLAVLFVASLVGYLAVRADAAQWPPPGMPALPAGLWVSTGILLVSSGTMHWALRGVRVDDPGALRAGLLATSALAVAFLASQVVGWWGLAQAHLTMRTNLYGFTFYMLTGLHALHVVGGLLPLGVTTVRALRGRYTARRHTGVILMAMYWHFLDAVWLVIFLTLSLFG